MGDYYFPALINPSIGIEPIPPPLSGSMLPLHQEVIYIWLIYITMEPPTTGWYEVISLWYR